MPFWPLWTHTGGTHTHRHNKNLFKSIKTFPNSQACKGGPGFPGLHQIEDRLERNWQSGPTRPMPSLTVVLHIAGFLLPCVFRNTKELNLHQWIHHGRLLGAVHFGEPLATDDLQPGHWNFMRPCSAQPSLSQPHPWENRTGIIAS